MGLQADSHTDRKAAKLPNYFDDAGSLTAFVELCKSNQSFSVESALCKSKLEIVDFVAAMTGNERLDRTDLSCWLFLLQAAH